MWSISICLNIGLTSLAKETGIFSPFITSFIDAAQDYSFSATWTSPHLHRHQIAVRQAARLVVHGDRAVIPGAGKRIGADQQERFVVGSTQLQNDLTRGDC